MDRDSSKILQRLVNQWAEVNQALAQLSSTAQVKPDNGWNVFGLVAKAPDNVVEFGFGPAVFNVPERANHVSADLFIVVEGCFGFRRDLFRADNDTLTTDSFKTRAGYFRLKGNSAEHIYGAHYDFALDELGHPLFHAQMRSFVDMWAAVSEQYSIDAMVTDRVNGILQTVRVPTAQMDIFSFFLQLFADHLLFPHSGPEERAAFNSFREKSSFIKGAGFQVARLATQAAWSCYRARHWYPAVT